MAIFPGIVILSERYGSGEPITDAEIDDLRSNVEPTTWLDLCRAREAAITAKAPRQLGLYPEGAQFRLKSGGPVMTVEDTRDSVKLVQCIWFDDEKHVQRDAFHKDALEAVSAVNPATAKAIERLKAWCNSADIPYLGGVDYLVADLRLALGMDYPGSRLARPTQ